MHQAEEARKEDELDMLLDDLRHGRSSESKYLELMEKLDRRKARRREFVGRGAKRSAS